MNQRMSITDLAYVTVPNLSPGGPELISTLSSDDLNLAQVAEVLEMHPVISVRLIGLANSAWSAPDRTIVDLQTACVRLGLNVVRSSVIAYALAAPFCLPKCQNFDARRFWTCTLLAAEAADRLSSQYQLENSMARTGGMLRNLGLIWLVDLAPEQTNRAFGSVAEGKFPDLPTALTECVGISHLQASKSLLTNWELPHELLNACEDEIKVPLASVSAQAARVASSVYMGHEFEDGPADPRCSSDELATIHADVSKLLTKLAMVAQSIAA
jgi:HD-like signal output (HDOD) protein